MTSTTQAVLRQHHFQVSLDVVSLYTSVPVDDALSVIRDKLLREAAIPSPLQTEDMMALLRAVFDQIYFTFEGFSMGCAASALLLLSSWKKSRGEPSCSSSGVLCSCVPEIRRRLLRALEVRR